MALRYFGYFSKSVRLHRRFHTLWWFKKIKKKFKKTFKKNCSICVQNKWKSKKIENGKYATCSGSSPLLRVKIKKLYRKKKRFCFRKWKCKISETFFCSKRLRAPVHPDLSHMTLWGSPDLLLSVSQPGFSWAVKINNINSKVTMSPLDKHFPDINLLGSDFLLTARTILTVNYIKKTCSVTIGVN